MQGLEASVVIPSNLDRGTEISPGDFVVISSTEGSNPSLAPAESLAPSDFDPDQVRKLFKEQAYPIGSYVESDRDPSSDLGGTWEQVFGAFLFGRKSGREVSDSSQLPAGSKTVTLYEAHLPVHAHTVNMSHTHGGTDVTHTHNTSHTHYPTTSMTHTHSVNAHTHRYIHAHPGLAYPAYIKNVFTTNYGLIQGSGEFANRVMVKGSGTKTGKWGTPTAGTSSGGLLLYTSSLVTYTELTTGADACYTEISETSSTTPNSTSYYTGYSGAVTGTSGDNSGTAPVSGIVGGSTGSGQAHENMPPYYATNIWQRVA